MSATSVVELQDVLLVTIQGELTDEDAMALQEELTTNVARSSARGVLIDVSGLDLVDSFLARTLHDIAGASALLAAETVVVGMRPEVAITLVELGLTLPGLGTALTVADGLDRLNGSARRR
ncbi:MULTISPECIES: STAS domain-containing protein [Prauserella]|uniref:UDP-glucose 6-dehydrogenase n=2 Tax=Prauserella TaxID=142577 RepID=A0A318LPH3_9PSEU|nr:MULTISPECIES: STAS domain-containing protein [Prauserella]PXY20611.1 UDP-glucose 6-dehydrogenase [Prauserella flavalba]PXY26540.1 UDP-glucose 6-dehydrogenase [Prauserella coralliicola]RBM10621.1 UDP-glucose 6-dehydrogenase [Prauserella sp. PE36]TKG58538.1 STAS domain-containing protein [Prauserella endophytica]